MYDRDKDISERDLIPIIINGAAVANPPLPEGIKLLSFSELDARIGKDLDYLVRPGLYRQGLTVLNADYGVGKTTLALQWAGAGIKGAENVVWKASKPFRTLFIFNEAQTSLAFFYREFERRHALKRSRLDSSIQFIDLDEEANARLLSPLGGDFDSNITAILSHSAFTMGGPVGLIIVDSAQFNLAGTVNDDGTIKAYFQAWRRIAKIKNVAVLVTWLANKSGGIAGSNNFPGIADMVLNIEGNRRNKPRYITTLKPPRLGPQFPDSSFSIKSDDELHLYVDDWRIQATGSKAAKEKSPQVSARDSRTQVALDFISQAGELSEAVLFTQLDAAFKISAPTVKQASRERYIREAIKDAKASPSVQVIGNRLTWNGTADWIAAPKGAAESESKSA